MGELSFLNLVAGIVAYIVAFIVGVGPLVHWTFFRFFIALTKEDEEDRLRQGNRAVAIDLGMTIVCQAILARHAVFAVMAVIRALFVEDLSIVQMAGVGLRSALIFVGLTGLSFFSVWLARKIFRAMTKRLNEEKEISNDNVAVALFSGLVLLAVAIILSDGMQDLSRSLIPYARSGVIQWP